MNTLLEEKGLKKVRRLEKLRIKLWCDVAVAYVNSSNSQTTENATIWADKITEDFDERFDDYRV